MTDTLSHAYLPYLRTGLSALVSGDAPAASDRAIISLGVTATRSIGDPAAPTEEKAFLRGPGDVIGVEPQVIGRRFPVAGALDAEWNHLALVEFTEPDFPWRHTPFGPKDNRLPPWLCLIVLREDEFKDTSRRDVRAITVQREGAKLEALLPKPEEAWAWAHVQVTFPGDGNLPERMKAELEELKKAGKEIPHDPLDPRFVRLLARHRPELVVSRLLCPRRLGPAPEGRPARLHAFLVPVFASGVAAGLRQPVAPAMGCSWAWDGTEADKRLPYYETWQFQTRAGGDFETLAGLLRPQQLGVEFGRLPIDVSQPGPCLSPPVVDGQGKAVMEIEGALTSLASALPPAPDPASDETLKPFAESVKSLLSPALARPSREEKDPFLLPPVYGRTYPRVPPSSFADASPWLSQVNLNPAYRAIAGVGLRVIQEDQEELMAAAWAQAGNLDFGKEAARWGQVGMAITGRLKERHVDKMEATRLVTATQRLHGKIAHGGGSIATSLGKTVDAPLATAPARSLMRPLGALARRIEPDLGKRIALLGEFGKKVSNAAIKVAELAPPSGAVFAADVEVKSDGAAGGGGGRAGGDRLAELRGEKIAAVTPSTTELPRFRSKWDGATERGALKIDTPASRKALRQTLALVLEAARLEGSRVSLRVGDVAGIASSIGAALDTTKTIAPAVKARFEFLRAGAQLNERLDLVMPHPVFTRPMSEPLIRAFPSLLLPGAEGIEQNRVGLLMTNQRFVEAYLLSLNHAMGAELFWREYPTDRRGSYFQQFWDRTSDPGLPPLAEQEKRAAYFDARPLSGWTGDLGTHGATDEAANAVIVVRGDLLLRYPRTAIYLVKATKEGEKYAPDFATAPEYPVFHGRLDPDITFVGFKVTKKQLSEDPGYFVVLEEQVVHLRAGLKTDMKARPDAPEPDSLSWWDFGGVPFLAPTVVPLRVGALRAKKGDAAGWAADSSYVVKNLFQEPMRVYVHTRHLVPK